MHDISVFDNVCLAFLLAVLHQLVLVSWVLYQSVSVDYFSFDEAFREVRVDLSPSFQRCFSFSNGPSSDLISANRIEVGNFQLIVTCPYYFIDL